MFAGEQVPEQLLRNGEHLAIETDWNNMAHVMRDNQVNELFKHSAKVLKNLLKSLKAQPSVSKAHPKGCTVYFTTKRD